MKTVKITRGARFVRNPNSGSCDMLLCKMLLVIGTAMEIKVVVFGKECSNNSRSNEGQRQGVCL